MMTNMSRYFFVSFFIIGLFSSCKQPFEQAVSYGNDMFSIHLNKLNDTVYASELRGEVSKKELKGCAKLIRIDNEVPECGLVGDYNNTDYIYQCDSTYNFVTNSFNMSFALEKESRERMDMQICNSAQTDFSDGGYTLYRLK